MKGEVISFSNLYGYGFIRGEDGRDYFVYYTFILGSGYRTLSSGKNVTFDPYETYKGWQARNVKLEEDLHDERLPKPNPFTPHQPITDPAKFAGRRDSLINAVDALFNRNSVMVSGERGVGKTSLATQLTQLTQGDTYLLEQLGIKPTGYNFNYLVIDYRCFPKQKIEDIISGLIFMLSSKLDAIERRTGKKVVHKINLKFYEAQIEKSFEPKLSTDIINKYVLDIENSWDDLIAAGYNGLCIFIDDLEWIDEGVPIASFLKAVMEKLRSDRFNDVCFIISGHISFISNLYRQHRSSLRLFENVPIKPMTDTELEEIIEKALLGTSVSISREAIDRIVSLATGYPTPVHQLGYHSFRYDRNNLLGLDDVEQALSYVIRELKNEEFTIQHKKLALGGEEELIRIIAKAPSDEVSMEYLFSNSGMTEKNVYGIIGGLMEKGYIVRARRGTIRIVEPLFRLYLRWKEGIA